jgi:hypothetical protein
MTRFACRFTVAAALVLGVVFVTASPAQAHHYWGWGPVVVAPRVYVPAYYGPRVGVAVVAAPAPVVVAAPTYYAPAPIVVAPPPPVVGAAIRVGPVGVGVGVGGPSVGVGIGIR